ncbi:MAG: DUF4349 domain-containing protein [Clostridia bacterium]|nr:DUF4349 domain-containing protein [Clostridia bacterium]
MNKKWFAAAAALLAIACVLGGCSAVLDANEYTDGAPRYEGGVTAMPQVDWESYDDKQLTDQWDITTTSPTDGESSAIYGEKRIKRGSLNLETREFDSVYSFIRERAEDLGGYVSSASVYGTAPVEYGDAGRTLELTIRVPAAVFDSFVEELSQRATVTQYVESDEDITESYYDVETRLEMYRKQHERVLELLDQAQTLDDILILEDKLSALAYEIDSLTGLLNKYDSLVAYSTLTVSMRELVIAETGMGDTLGTRISEAFSGTVNGLADFGEGLLIVLIGGFPVIAIIAVIIVVVVLLVRRGNRKKAARAAADNADAPK